MGTFLPGGLAWAGNQVIGCVSLPRSTKWPGRGGV